MIHITKIKKICIGGLLVRIVALILTLSFSNQLTTGYMRSTYQSDDLRYLDGAIAYRDAATQLIDPPAFLISFLSTGDHVGYSDDIALWYWLMCIFMYVFKSPIIAKLINILFGVWSIYYIYKLCEVAYPRKRKVASLAASLYAYFPYPVFFCCFVYKDQFLTLITLAIVYLIYKEPTIFKVKTLLKLTLLLLMFTLIRSGLLPLLVLCIGYTEVQKNKERYGLHNPLKNILLCTITLILTIVFYIMFADVIMHKYEAYVANRASGAEESTITYFTINGPKDIWRAPFAYIFTIIQPLYIGGKVTNWSGVVGILNACSIPVVIVNLYYWIGRKTNKLLWITVMVLFMVMLIVSMGISRHFYYLLPFVFIFYADAIVSGNQKTKNLNDAGILLAVVYSTIFIIPTLCLI